MYSPIKEKCDDKRDRLYEDPQQVFSQFPKNHMNIWLGDISAKVVREDTSMLTTGKGSVHETSSNDRFITLNIATLKLLEE